MSGLCGWFGRTPIVDPAGTLDRMVSALPNHGTTKTYKASGPNFGLALHSHPAMSSFTVEAEIRVAIEGYPRWSDESLAKIAEGQGHACALLAAYRRAGSELFPLLRGTFAFAVIDLAKEQALFAIDRFGIQTLNYAQPSGDLVVFGSTTDAVRAQPQVGATIRIQSIFEYLYFVDRIVAPTTIYQEQRKLAPAEYLVADQNRATVAAYWRMPYRSSAQIDKETAATELKTRLRNVVSASLAGEDDRRVGAFLSGGLDSSSVVGFAAESLAKKLQTFTIGFGVEGFDEAEYANIVAKHFGSNHHTYYVQPQDVLDVVLKASEIYDEPFANSSFIPAYYCARLAAESGVEMMLAGDGGDELFAGNKQYVADAVFDHYAKLPGFVRKGIAKPLISRLSAMRHAPLFGKPIRYIERAEKSVADRMADNLFRVIDPSEVFTADTLAEIDFDAPRLRSDEIYRAPEDASKVQRMMHLDLRVLLAASDLPKVMRMCELVGIRARFPFLSEEIAEFAAQLPESLLLEGGMLRSFYKGAMRGFLPDATINKQKHGFGLPYTAFMNSHARLRELICDSLLKLKRRGYFAPRFLDGLIERAHHGRLEGHETVAWDFLVLELWLALRT